MRTIARWTEWDGDGLQHVVIEERADGVGITGVAISTESGDAPQAYRFDVELDAAWCVRRAEVERIGDAERVVLTADGKGNWSDGAGRRLTELDGAIDIDLAFSPLTNTLPIRRLALEAGRSQDIVTAYIARDLSVLADPQRYTCIELGRLYRYDSRDSDFTAEIEVDSAQLVVLYPGLFRRV